MIYQLLGNSTLSISRIGLGCMSLKPENASAASIIEKAIELGINYFDTADLYDHGLNETLLGRVLAGKRKDVILATKAGNQWKADGSGWTWNASKKYILDSAEASLKRLNTDYIDLFQLHGGTLEDDTDETIEAFEILVAAGKIRYYGISSIRPNVIRRWIEKSNLVSVMTQYSLLDRRPEEATLQLLKEKNIGVLARGAVASGLLVNKPAAPYLDHNADQVKLARELLTQIRDSAIPAIQFVLQHPAISSAIVGMSTLTQLNEAVAAINAVPLNENDLLNLRNSIPAFTYHDHR